MSGRSIALVGASLRCGGAERAASLLASRLASRGNRVALITFTDASDDFYRVGPGVERVGLAVASDGRARSRGVLGNLRRARAVRRAVREHRAELVVAFCAEVAVVCSLASHRQPWRLLASERTDPRVHPLPPLWRFAVRRAYRRCAMVVPNGAAVAGWLRDWLGHPRVVAIPNMIDDRECFPDRTPVAPKRIVHLARLVPSKGHADLLRAFAAVGERGGWQLHFLGDGPLAAELGELATKLGVADDVVFRGKVEAPGKELALAELFAFPSHYEGFPNALLEALAVGLPALAYEGVSGVAELFAGGRGVAVPRGDVDAFAHELERLMRDEERRAELARKAVGVRDDFATEAVVARWEALFEEVLRSGPRGATLPDSSRE